MQQNVVQPIQDGCPKIVREQFGDLRLQVGDGVSRSVEQGCRCVYPIGGYDRLTFARSFIQFKLPISMRQIERGVISRRTQLDQFLFDDRHWVMVLYRILIDRTEVNSEAEL